MVLLPKESQENSDEKGGEGADPVDVFGHVHGGGELGEEQVVHDVSGHMEEFVHGLQLDGHSGSNNTLKIR